MSDATTPVLGLTKPAVGASRDTWGTKWNANADLLDSQQGEVNGDVAALQTDVNYLMSALGNYLPIAGGTVTGALSVQGNLHATGGRLFSGPGNTGDPCICLYDSVQGFAVGWRGTSGLLEACNMDAGGNAVSTLGWFDAGGNFTAAGAITATYYTGGNVDVSGYIVCGGELSCSFAVMNGVGVQYPYFGQGSLHAQWFDVAADYLFPAIDGGLGLGWYQTTGSDVRLKRNIRPCGDALADLARFNVVAFDKLASGRRLRPQAYGLIADEVERHAPDVAPRPSDPNAMRGLDLLPLMARCVRAIQQLAERVEQLERRL